MICAELTSRGELPRGNEKLTASLIRGMEVSCMAATKLTSRGELPVRR